MTEGMNWKLIQQLECKLEIRQNQFIELDFFSSVEFDGSAGVVSSCRNLFLKISSNSEEAKMRLALMF